MPVRSVGASPDAGHGSQPYQAQGERGDGEGGRVDGEGHPYSEHVGGSRRSSRTSVEEGDQSPGQHRAHEERELGRALDDGVARLQTLGPQQPRDD